MTKTEETRRRVGGAPASVSLENFAQRRGQVRALEEFHKRKDRKRLETAKALRNYRKVMKQQGFEAGHGASRKRKDKQESDDEEEEKPPATTPSSEITTAATPSSETTTDAPKRHKRQKTNPFQKSLEKAQENREKAVQQKSDKKSREKERKQKLRDRKVQTRKLNQRTKKGQPIMKNVVENMLRQLEKQG